jgi:CheY-like chemotaxis protein
MAIPAPPRLLVVDDVADNRTILTRSFTRQGYEVVEAEGGARALELIASQAFDAVLLDIMMPEIDGLEVLKRVRETRSQAELPIVLVSAKATSEDVVEGLLLGANDYVTKPVDLKVARARVEAQLVRKRTDDRSRAAHRELEEALHKLRGKIRESEDRPPLDSTLGVATVVTRICETPGLRETIELIDQALVRLSPYAAEASRAEPAGRTVRILSADANAADRQVVRLMLAEAEAGIELVEVADGASARTAVAEGRFDLIVMGLRAPLTEGLGAIGDIRDHETRRGLDRTPVLVLSADPADGPLALQAGADLHLAKPVTAAALLNAVVRALSQSGEPLSAVA